MKRGRRGWGLGLCAALLGAVVAMPATGSASPKVKLSPPGQILIVTVNAAQMMKSSAETKARLNHLVHALSTRPSAFDGGFVGAVFSPDVIVTQEMKASALQWFADRLTQRLGDKYQVVGLTDTAAEFVIDTETIAVNGPVVESPDSCDGALGGKRLSRRFYDIGQFTEKATDTDFVVAGVHLSHQYARTQQPLCYERNILQLRTELETLTPPIFIAGDFNQRAVQERHECDPEEQSPPTGWWLEMTAPSMGRPYVDSVQSFVKARGGSMAGEWTERQAEPTRLCNGKKGRHRGRIDYIFESGSVVAQAHVDKFPQRARTAYSDHRFVWGRFVIAGPPTPSAPTATAEAGGVIKVEWKPDASAQQWLVYRALGDHPYKLLDRLPPGTTSLDDSATDDGDLYRYSVAAVGTGGGRAPSRPPRRPAPTPAG
ncbi:MAG: endonuclease/exonuclease/phosphatase family protein, partial [Actinomycetota bacterium]|nr:endonuclease/exonuclease/phosphatase family protein [Actinomycetota bacterium]